MWSSWSEHCTWRSLLRGSPGCIRRWHNEKKTNQPNHADGEMAECRGLAPLARRHALVSTEARLACPVDIPNWSAWLDLHLHSRRFDLRASALGYTRLLN